MKKLKALCLLFLSMFKIGLFTFGGGYAMISLLENEFVEKRNWLDNEEFMNLVTIAESTPGPIAINCATYIGYKTNKLLGAVVATIAMCIPSFVIIFIISLFFNRFLGNKYVAAAFKGVQICVLFLILWAGIKMIKKVKKSIFNIIIFCVTIGCMIVFSLFVINFSSVFYIIISGTLGLLVYSTVYFSKKQKAKQISDSKNEKDNNNDDSGEEK